MGVTEILHEIEALPGKDRQALFARLGELAESDIPASFRQGMAEAARGELVDLDEALRELERP